MSVVEPPTIAGGPPPYRETPAPHASAQRGVPWLTVIILWSAAGIALLSVSYALARANVELDAARLLYWAALAAIAGPALVRMLAPSASRSERILLVALTTLFLYWIKVLHDPVGLFIPDEFYHLANAQRLAETGQLYGENLLLPVSPDYPGLTVITVALSKLSGLGLFPCALVLVGIVKIGLAVVLFLLFERLSGSARIGGVAALLYCAHSNYLYFTSQFSYESLSVPLLACVLLCLVARNGLERPQRAAWSAIGCLLTCAVVVTHHLTAYALVVILWAQVVLTLVKRRPDVRPPLAMAVVATTASVIWAMTVAGETGGYLGSIFDRLDGAISESVRTEAVTRVPFQSGTGGNFGVQGPPLDDRLFSVAAVLLVTLGVFTGLIVTWRRRWRDPFVVLLGLAALAAIGAYPLRLHPASWEISNRTSEFLFLGVAIFSAVAAVAFVGRGRGRWRVFAIAGAGVVAIAGGAVIGWPGGARLPRPVTAKVAGAHIDAPGPLMADWARAHLPRDSVMVANDSDGRLLAVAGFNHVFAGPTHAVPELLAIDVIPQWQWDFLREEKVTYVVLNRRVESRDNVIGYFYPRPVSADKPPVYNWANVRRKYEVLPGAVRIYDSGDIVIYDIRRPLRTKQAPFDD